MVQADIHHGSVPHSIRLPAHPRLLVVGDSLTVGFYATTQAQSYVALLTSALGAQLIATEGKYGVNVPYTLRSLQQHPAPQADLIIVELGTNDTEADFDMLYLYLLGLVTQPSPHATLVCLGPWQSHTKEHDAIAAAIRSFCELPYGGIYVDLQSLYYAQQLAYHGPAGRQTWLGTGDWFHPNDLGHAAIAQAIERALGFVTAIGG